MAKNSECFGMEGCNICHTNTHDQEKRNKNKLNMVVNIICLASLHYQDYFFVVVTVWTVFTATIFKASALWADAFYKSKCPYVADFALQNMVETTLPDELETSGQRVYC